MADKIRQTVIGRLPKSKITIQNSKVFWFGTPLTLTWSPGPSSSVAALVKIVPSCPSLSLTGRPTAACCCRCLVLLPAAAVAAACCLLLLLPGAAACCLLLLAFCLPARLQQSPLAGSRSHTCVCLIRWPCPGGGPALVCLCWRSSLCARCLSPCWPGSKTGPWLAACILDLPVKM